jgi:hypothetical protein
MRSLSPDVAPYKHSSSLDRATIPKGFLSDHTTKSGIWGILVNESGRFTYAVTEPDLEEGGVWCFWPVSRRKVAGFTDGVGRGNRDRNYAEPGGGVMPNWLR